MKKVILDTNVYRNISSESTLKQGLQKALARDNSVIFVSYVTLLELLSHISSGEKENDFQQCVSSLSYISEMRMPNFLPHPDDILRIAHANVSFDCLLTDCLHFYLMCMLFRTCKTYSDLDTAQILEVPFIPKTQYRVWWKNFNTMKLLEDLESDYILDMLNLVIKPIDPDFEIRDTGSGPIEIPKTEIKTKTLDFIKSTNFDVQFAKTLAAYRLKIAISEMELKLLSVKILPIIDSYRNLFLKVLTKGYRFSKKGNDIHDLHQIFYLTDPEAIIISEDAQLKNKLTEPTNNARILKIEDYISRKPAHFA